jgi:hypothetical protein
VRESLVSHIRDSPEPVIVVEEYDKLDCPTRAFLRQLLQHPELANTTFNRWAAPGARTRQQRQPASRPGLGALARGALASRAACPAPGR